jgi:hypothetical protein
VGDGSEALTESVWVEASWDTCKWDLHLTLLVLQAACGRLAGVEPGLCLLKMLLGAHDRFLCPRIPAFDHSALQFTYLGRSRREGGLI